MFENLQKAHLILATLIFNIAFWLYIYIAKARKAGRLCLCCERSQEVPEKGERNPRLFCCAGCPARVSWSASGPQQFFVIGEISQKKRN